jgi:hypothetical protein
MWHKVGHPLDTNWVTLASTFECFLYHFQYNRVVISVGISRDRFKPTARGRAYTIERDYIKKSRGSERSPSSEPDERGVSSSAVS